MHNTLFRLTGAEQNSQDVEEWLASDPAVLFAIARLWFGEFRRCGPDVNELLHDGCPTACIGEAAFGYVNVFRSHVNVGFFTGAFLDDPGRLLEGSGKRMRHVKIRPDRPLDDSALRVLIQQAYRDVQSRITAGY